MRPAALGDLLVHALADLFAQVAEVELGDRELHVAQQLALGRVGHVADDVASPHADDLFEQHLIGEVAIEPVELVSDDDAHVRVRP